MGIIALKIVGDEIEFADNALTVITDAEALRQRLKNRMLLWLGEWFLAPTVGIDWLDILESKPANLVEVDRRLRAELLSDPAVTGITEYESSFDRSARKLTVSWAVTTDVGLVRGEAAIP